MSDTIDLGRVRAARGSLAALAAAHPELIGESSGDNRRQWEETLMRAIKRNCAGCGKEFDARRIDQMYHDTACKHAARRARQAATLADDPLDAALARALATRRTRSADAQETLQALYDVLSREVGAERDLTLDRVIDEKYQLECDLDHTRTQLAAAREQLAQIAAREEQRAQLDARAKRAQKRVKKGGHNPG